MERFITDARTDIDYELIGDYYIPCLKGPSSPVIGKYGRMRQRYLKQNHRLLYYNLLTSCKLHEHLADVDKQAEELFLRLVKDLAEKKRVNEQLKADDMMKWVRMMNNIRACAEEVVMSDLIYA